MKKNICYGLIGFLIIACIYSCSSSKKVSRNTTTLKVLSYNIHHANPPSKVAEGLIDLEAIARVINTSGADLVGLQEIDVHTLRSGKDLDQAKRLAGLTNMHFYFVKGIDYQDGEYGIAILSRYPILKKDSLRLPMKEGLGGEPRVMAAITIEPLKGEKIIFATTHLDLKKENRALQIDAIIDYFQNSRIPVVLSGDFNAIPESNDIRKLDQHFKRSSIPNGFTIPVIHPNREIDFIMYRPPDNFNVLKHEIIPEEYASDHLPVYVELEYKKKP